MKYVLFIAMDLALYPFLLLFFIGGCIKDKIIRTFALSTR